MARQKTAFLIVDIQYDFLPLPGSTLGVDDGTSILPVVNDMLNKEKWGWDIVAVSQDWHPANHVSFASNNGNAEPFSERKVMGKFGELVSQIMWPVHCVQGSRGAEIEESINAHLKPWKEANIYLNIKKGTDPLVDAYSAFASEDSPMPDPGKGEDSPLAAKLKALGIERVVCVGIATDVCVRATCLSSCAWGFDTIIVPEAVRSVKGKEAEEKTYREIEEKGGRVVSLGKLAEVLGFKQ